MKRQVSYRLPLDRHSKRWFRGLMVFALFCFAVAASGRYHHRGGRALPVLDTWYPITLGGVAVLMALFIWALPRETPLERAVREAAELKAAGPPPKPARRRRRGGRS